MCMCSCLCALFREFQWLSHLPLTGRLDSATLGKMTSPRCGVKDAQSHSAWGQRVNNIFTGYMNRHEQHLRKKRNAVSGLYTSYASSFMCIGLIAGVIVVLENITFLLFFHSKPPQLLIKSCAGPPPLLAAEVFP